MDYHKILPHNFIDIHGVQRMNPTDFAVSLTFSPTPPAGQNYNKITLIL